MAIPRSIRLPALAVALGGSVWLLFADTREGFLVEGHWNMDWAATEVRCPTVDPARVAWNVTAPEEFLPLALSFREALGVVCADNCLAQHEVELTPTWVERPGFFSGYGAIDVPMRITRTVGSCTDSSSLHLDIRVDEGRRGRAWFAAATAGRVAGTRSLTLFADWRAASTTTSKSAVQSE